MGKQPYIQFYLGDYIKDTRILPLNVKGGWVDLILAMWEHTPKGELIGSIEDYARIMNCSKDEATLVIQTLKQKKIFDYEELKDGNLRIVSRKQKKMEKLSEIRKTSGKEGGNPSLLNQKDKQIPEYENEYENEYKNEYKSEIKNDNKKFFGKSENLSAEIPIIPQMAKLWYENFPTYSSDKQNDFEAMGKILGFMQRQAGIKNVPDSDEQIKILNTIQLIADIVSTDTFWINKPIKSIANNIQEFYNKLKNPQTNGSSQATKQSTTADAIAIRNQRRKAREQA